MFKSRDTSGAGCLACEAEGVATQSVCRVQYGRFTGCRAYERL